MGTMSQTNKIIFVEIKVRMRYLIISGATVAKILECTCKFHFNHVVYFVEQDAMLAREQTLKVPMCAFKKNVVMPHHTTTHPDAS